MSDVLANSFAEKSILNESKELQDESADLGKQQVQNYVTTSNDNDDILECLKEEYTQEEQEGYYENSTQQTQEIMVQENVMNDDLGLDLNEETYDQNAEQIYNTNLKTEDGLQNTTRRDLFENFMQK